MKTKTDPNPALIASELRAVLGQLLRRLRAENRFPISHGAVLGRLDREGPQSVSELAIAERVRPQSMAQTMAELEASGYVSRRPDAEDRRRWIVDLTEAGRTALNEDRRMREGWLAGVIAEDLSDEQQIVLRDAVELLRLLAEAE